MSGAVDAVASFDFGSVVDFASDLGSVVTDFGTEFMTSLDITSFEIPSFDVASLGGFGEVGSFAGSASWFDTFNPGAILDSIPSVSDFNISSLTSNLPSLSSIKDTLTTFSNDVGGFVKTAQTAVNAYQKVAPVVNAGFNALGIQNPLTEVAQAAQQTLGVAGAAAGFARGAATGVDTLGKIQDKATSIFTSDPNAAQTPSLFEQAKTGLSNLFTTDPNSTNARDAATGLPINTPREISDDPFEQARLDAEREANRPGPTQAAVVDQLGIVDRISLTADQFAQDFKGLVTEYPGVARVASQATGIPLNSAGNTTDPYGLNILTDAQSNALFTRNVTPGLVNSFTDPQVSSPSNYNQAVASRADLLANRSEILSAITANEQVIRDSKLNIEEIQQNLLDPDLSDAQRETLRASLAANEASLAEANDALFENQSNLQDTSDQLDRDQQIITQTNASVVTAPADAEDPFEAARQAAAANFNAASPTEADVLAAINGQTAALTNQARAQQSVRALRNNKAQATDWRVRLKLAPNSNYLYNAPAKEVGILAPLALTDGVIFPYTPSIETAYKANYDAYDLTHSNYRGYFYKSSHVDAVNVRGTFTAQDSKEADYLLAVIHFFRSCTKMFYGKDAQRGAPPPLVYLNGYGDYQFAEHPCVVSQFNYTLPPDVDYIRCQSTLQNNTNRLNSRLRNPIANNPLAYSVNRLLNSSLVQGALNNSPLATANNLASSDPTYVPTKMEISITLLPMQSRSQISNNFSVKEFANGNLLKGGYW